MDAASLDSYLFHRELRAQFDWAPEPDELFIAALDGAQIAASLWQASSTSRSPRRGLPIVVAPATGVKRAYYAPFARFLASSGFDVVTFDYRGIGDSRRAGDRARMREWGELDLAGVVRWTSEELREHGPASIGIVGHSVGGQLVGLLPDVERIQAIVTVGAQSGDYRLWPMPSRLAMALLWHALVPAITHTVGYFPGSLGIGEDLPAGVALEWARWCRTPGYFAGGDGPARTAAFSRVRSPILAFGFDDDTYAPRAAIDALLRLYDHAPIERRQIDRVRGSGKRKIGHFGFFRPRFEGTLWEEARAFLRGNAR